jgi:hypothetical protein
VRWLGHDSVLVFDYQSSGTIQALDVVGAERVAWLDAAHSMRLIRGFDGTDLLLG